MVIGGAHWWGWATIGLAIIAEYTTVSMAIYHAAAQTEPREPFARWAQDRMIKVQNREGIRWNIPGILETVTVFPLLALGPWAMPDAPVLARLLVVAAAEVHPEKWTPS